MCAGKGVGFTGTRKGMTEEQKRSFALLLETLGEEREFECFHHGDCKGADAEAHRMVLAIQDQGYIPIVIHPPKVDRDRAFCDENGVKDAVTARPVKGYLERNHAIVNETGLLIACPETRREKRRSGTWATIRYARKQEMSIYFIWPNGQVTFEEL